MSKLGLLHILVGFWLIFLASCGGFFVADDQHNSFVQQRPQDLISWWMVLQASAHGHTNLFGMLHVLVGLTLPYSMLSVGWKTMQFGGLLLGSFTMSALMIIRSLQVPDPLSDPLGIVMGGLLSCALLAIVLHIIGLSMKWYRLSSFK